MVTREPGMITNLEHIVRSPLNTSFWCPFLDPRLTIHHSNIGVCLRYVTELGQSTLQPTLHEDIITDSRHVITHLGARNQHILGNTHPCLSCELLGCQQLSLCKPCALNKEGNPQGPWKTPHLFIP
jgi:hypothetical protein